MKAYEGLCNQKSEVLLESLPLSRGEGLKNVPNNVTMLLPNLSPVLSTENQIIQSVILKILIER